MCKPEYFTFHTFRLMKAHFLSLAPRSLSPMLRSLLLLVALLASSFSRQAWGYTFTSHIKSADDFLFCAGVVENHPDYEFELYLDNDITIYLNSVMGESVNTSFKGLFDGQGHTITIRRTAQATMGRRGLFGFVYNATIRDLNVAGEIGYISVAGPVGGVADWASETRFEHVHSSVWIHDPQGDYSRYGGLVGEIWGGTSLIGCTYSGTLDAGRVWEGVGGLVGFAGAGLSDYDQLGTIANCLMSGRVSSSGQNPVMGGILGDANCPIRAGQTGLHHNLCTGEVSGNGPHVGAIIGRVGSASTLTDATYHRNYYLATDGLQDVGSGFDHRQHRNPVTQLQLQHGDVCWELNTDNTGSPWHQTLGMDTAPTLSATHGTLYQVGSHEGHPYFANSEGGEGYHLGTELCQVCGYVLPLPQAPDGWYEIWTAHQLLSYLCRDQIWDNARLMADIVLNDGTFNAEGNYTPGPSQKALVPLSGARNLSASFDGQGHSIRGAYEVNERKQAIGLFANTFNDGKVMNLGVVHSYFKGNLYAGAIAGWHNGVSVSHCYAIDTYTFASTYVGQLVGDNLNKTVEYSWAAGGNASQAVAGLSSGNCCYGYTAADDPALASGELCYKLNNNGQLDGWRQTLGEDPYPVPDPRHAVVYCPQPCPSYTNDGSNLSLEHHYSETVYPSTCATKGYTLYHCTVCGDEHKGETTTALPHSYSNGLCIVCGAKETDFRNPEDGYYEISSLNQLLWYLNTQDQWNDITTSARLMANITVNTLTYDAEGQLTNDVNTLISLPMRCLRSATFDGQGHTLSGLYASAESGHVGLFAHTFADTVRSLTVRDSYFNASDGDCGAIVGFLYVSSTISDCQSLNNKVVGNDDVGGICGCVDENSTLTNCLSTSNVSGNDQVGGICGYLGDGSNLTNCLHVGLVEGNDGVGPIVGYNNDNGTLVSNCYHYDNAENDELLSGKVCYLLNGSEPAANGWYQRIGTDPWPHFTQDKDQNTVYYDPERKCYYNTLINTEKELNELTVIMLRDYLLGRTRYLPLNADINKDGCVDVADLVMVIKSLSPKGKGDAPENRNPPVCRRRQAGGFGVEREGD